jgi:hypothetical protein
LCPEAEDGVSGSRFIARKRNEEESPNTEGQSASRVCFCIESEGSAGNILRERKVSQKIHIPFSSKEESEKQVKRWCKRPPHHQ